MTAGPEEIAIAVTRLRAGGLVAFPTETVYGLGADAANPRAVAAVFALKGRPSVNPLILHVADETMARSAVAAWPSEAAALTRAFWPGPLTLVLPKAASISDTITAGGPTVAVRSPAHHIALGLLAAFGAPLVGPSANLSGRVSPTTAEHVREAFSEQDVYVLDGGPCRGGIESTVITLSGPTPHVLRPGLISADDISRVLGRPVAARLDQPTTGTPLASPGQLPIHYAPRARTVLAMPDQLDAALHGTPGRAVILSYSRAAAPAPHALIPMPADAAAYASRLYSALHEADSLHPSVIIIERPPTSGPIWQAIADRLARASSPPP